MFKTKKDYFEYHDLCTNHIKQQSANSILACQQDNLESLYQNTYQVFLLFSGFQHDLTRMLGERKISVDMFFSILRDHSRICQERIGEIKSAAIVNSKLPDNTILALNTDFNNILEGVLTLEDYRAST